MLSLGALLSFTLNWVTSFGHSFWSLLVPWAANGLVQSMGWAPGSRLLSNWWAPHERGKAFGFYVFSAGFSSVLIFGLAIWVLKYLSWRWLFRLPVLLLLGGGVVFYLRTRERPEDMGFEPLPDEPSQTTSTSGKESWVQRCSHILSNWRFVAACISIGFESVARYGLLIWVPFHYMGGNWKDKPGSVWITLALPIGMALGALTSGYVSDLLFHSNRSRPIATFLVVATGVCVLLLVVPKEERLVGLVLLFLAGFFVYGPQASFWALCPDLLGRKRAATGVGFMNACAYGFAALGEPTIGWVIEKTGNTASAFGVVAAVCALGAACILPVKR
jgi:MFS transporter, OPA family, glycerol-3-phosphate transporter